MGADSDEGDHCFQRDRDHGSERSDAGKAMVLELIGSSQLQFSFYSIFPFLSCRPPAGAVETWESGAFCRISKPGGKGGNSKFEFSRQSTRRHFHGAVSTHAFSE